MTHKLGWMLRAPYNLRGFSSRIPGRPPASMANREIRLRAISANILAVCMIAEACWAQQIQFGFLGQPTQIELTAPQVDVVSGAVAARLDQARNLVAAHNWEEAIDIYRELAASKSDRLVKLDDARFINLQSYAQRQIALLPKEGLTAYRRRVDAVAEKLYREGLANRDTTLLERIVNEYFCSSWGDDALDALGEIALERGDYSTARRSWEQISPFLRSPDGRSLWRALTGIDLATKWPEIEQRWQNRKHPAVWLAYPDTQLNLAAIQARLVLVSIREGNLDRAAVELAVFRHMHSDAIGMLAGQSENYVAALERVFASSQDWAPPPFSQDWPTYRGSFARTKQAGPIGTDLVPIWKIPISLTPPEYVQSIRLRQGGLENGANNDRPQIAVRESQRPLSTFPIVAGDKVLFADGLGIHAAMLATGQPAVTADGLVYRDERMEAKGVALLPFNAAVAGVSYGVPRLSLTATRDLLFARIGALPTLRAQPATASADNRIIGLDLRRDGLLSFQSPREEPGWSFDGTPVSDGRSVYVAMRHSDVSPHAYIACFDATSGIRRWRTSIGAADTPASGEGDEITHNLVTVVGDRIYFNSNLGLVAAIDAHNGSVCWIRGYDRIAGKLFAHGPARPPCFDRDPAPCLYHDGLVVVAPADSPAIFALDAETGQLAWQNHELPDALHLLGLAGNNLVVAGDRIAALDFATGRVNWIWPESAQAGIRGMGIGVLAGSEVFWPTRDAIFVLDTKTGGQTRSPIPLTPLSGGANLIASQGRLIAAGYDKMLAFGPISLRDK